MPSNFITTVCGPDIPGIIKELAECTRRHGGEWLTSKVIKLDGQFAAIMSVVVQEQHEKKLKQSLEGQFENLKFIYSPAETSFFHSSKTINLVVDCIDRPGLTANLTNILANLGIVVENMECKRFAMDGIGDVFSAKLTLAVAQTADSKVIAEEIETLSEDVRVLVQ